MSKNFIISVACITFPFELLRQDRTINVKPPILTMLLLIQISTLALLAVLLFYLSYWFVTRKVFLNHRRLSAFAKYFYNYLHSHKAIQHIRVSNYGYAPVDDDVAHYDSHHRYGLQLYKELVKNHKGFLIGDKSRVVEVGCGKGAGAEFLINKFRPVSYTGIDFSEPAIEFCHNYFPQGDQTKFICATADRLPVNQDSADVVINVESSHIYPHIGNFFNEVRRILKPGGRFLLTDYRIIENSSIDSIEKLITEHGFDIEEKRIISEQVHTACTEASESRKKIIDDNCPWYLKKYFQHYAILNGSKKSQMLANGKIVYFIYHLVKK